jgi:hypothetical protein
VSSERDPFRQLWESVVPPSPDDLRELARTASLDPQRAGMQPPRRRWLRPRRAVAIGAVALLVGSGLGFGIGSSLTPSGSAGRNVVGFGFLPDSGWKVVQTAGPEPGTTIAVASKDGTELSVASTPRGDPAEDLRYPTQELPLRVADGRRFSGDPTQLELRAGVGGYNVDAHISFPTLPTASMLATAQRQLNRLVVAADRVTIAVRPAISSRTTSQVTVFGTVDRAKAGESVTIQAKECDNSFFRVYAGANTEADGTWSTFIWPSITMQLRAVWNGETSSEVTFRHRPYIQFRQQSATRFRIGLGYGTRFAGKRVNVQRFDQRLGRWQTIRTVALASGYATYVTLRVPKGTRLRTLLPNSQAAPCYVGTTSPVIRT